MLVPVILNIYFYHASIQTDIIKDIKDPEKPQTLEELEVLTEESVKAEKLSDMLLNATGIPSYYIPKISIPTFALLEKSHVNTLVAKICC